MSEIFYGSLVGGNDMGVTKGECHTLNLRYPAQYRDNTRNFEINSKAAR
jgi:hypothetical protein